MNISGIPLRTHAKMGAPVGVNTETETIRTSITHGDVRNKVATDSELAGKRSETLARYCTHP
jgi:hypothetical protein